MKLLIKIGGSLLDEPQSREALARQIAAVNGSGNRLVIVHGGGRQLTRFLAERGVASEFVNGLRVTTEETIDAVLKVLAGTVNKQLVASLRAVGVNAVGLSGLDACLTSATQMSADLGWVGRIASVDPRVLELLTESNYLPAVACVAGDAAGSVYNVNADQMAAACAVAFRADRLIFLTDVAGVLDRGGSLIPRLSREGIRSLIEAGVAQGGMRAKLEAASQAVNEGVGSVTIAAGTADGILSDLLAGAAQGTRLAA